MAIKSVDLPLFPNASYQYTTTLQRKTYKLKIVWNERASKWFLNLYDEDGTPLVLGVGLVPYYPIAIDYHIEGLTGYFALLPLAENWQGTYEKDPRNIYDYFSFHYIYEED